MAPRLAPVACLALVAACKLMSTSSPEEDIPVTFYGKDGRPAEPPPPCEFVKRIEVTRLENKEPPLDKIADKVRDENTNAVAYVRREGFKDGYIGKEYRFVASLYRCPFEAPAASASAVAPAK
ncbi:MAG: hypothetical protein IPM79_13140 [Polyangiaceae bacterium]|nr:hypothetical protein [Polyangiaceae bacterium]